ncbi:hypothetical protein ACQUW5_04600 [Legionella sp. CNM-1927-20]|uniref:hypothetical protein n=1 Tax=Legionella sp. CNM-1927-20 TaxID=3422221 RepID=UPI00403ADA10
MPTNEPKKDTTSPAMSPVGSPGNVPPAQDDKDSKAAKSPEEQKVTTPRPEPQKSNKKDDPNKKEDSSKTWEAGMNDLTKDFVQAAKDFDKAVYGVGAKIDQVTDEVLNKRAIQNFAKEMTSEVKRGLDSNFGLNKNEDLQNFGKEMKSAFQRGLESNFGFKKNDDKQQVELQPMSSSTTDPNAALKGVDFHGPVDQKDDTKDAIELQDVSSFTKK